MRHIYFLWGVIALLAVASLFSLVRVQMVQAHQNDALSAIMCHAEHLIRTSKGITPKQRHQAIRFYQDQIRLEHLKPCS